MGCCMKGGVQVARWVCVGELMEMTWTQTRKQKLKYNAQWPRNSCRWAGGGFSIIISFYSVGKDIGICYWVYFKMPSHSDATCLSLSLQGTTLLFICAQNTSNNGSFFFRTRDLNNSNNTLSSNERVRLQIHLYSYIYDPTKNTPSHKDHCVVFKTWFTARDK